MALPASRRWMLAGGLAIASLLGGLTFAAHEAKARVLAALGPRTTVGHIRLGYPRVTLRDVRVAATPGKWPAAEEFHAAQVEVSISVASLWALRRGEPLRVDDIRVSDGAIGLLRTRGHLTLLPSLRDASRAESASMAASQVDASTRPTALVLRSIHFENMALDLYDATLADTPHVRLEGIHGSTDDIALPTLDQPVAIDLAGMLKGIEHDGPVSLHGRVTPSAHDADLSVRLDQADMVVLQPWLRHLGERPIRHGRMDLSLDVHVQDRALHAPGSVTLDGLEFGESEGNGTLAGVERRMALAALKHDGRIALKFTVDGRTDDPHFALDDWLVTRIAAGLGDAVGHGVRDVVEGVGGLFKRH